MLSLVAALSTQGCVTAASTQSVKVGELPKLNPSFSGSGISPQGAVYIYSSTKVETPEGKLIEVDGDYDLDITLDNGKVVSFRRPIRTEITGGTIRITSGERGPFVTQVARVEKAEIPRVDILVTTLVIVGGLALLGGAIALAEAQNKSTAR